MEFAKKLESVINCTTSGPWVVENETLYGKDFGYTVPLADLGFYAENERHEEDSQLIAMAPDLAKIALAAIKYMEAYHDTDPDAENDAFYGLEDAINEASK